MSGSLADLLSADGDDRDEVVVITDEGETTRRELLAASEAIAGELRAAGVQPGMPVAAQLADGPELIAALFGVWHADAVYVPVNPRSTETERARLYDVVRPAALVRQTAAGRVIERFDAPAIHDADIALVQTTSGTTGRPKPVLLRHSGVLELMDGVLSKIRGAAGATSRSETPVPNLIPVSLSLWAGIYNVLFAFRVGAPVVVMGRFETGRFAELVRRYEIRSTVLPPAAMSMLSRDDDVVDLAPLRFVRSITAPLSPLEARRFHDKFGVAVLNSYGQTEIGGEIIGWTAADSRRFGGTKLGALGRPHAGVSVRVDDATGELQVRTPAMSAGYADGADLGDRLTADGWFRTGDLGRVDDDGFVWIDGRMSEMINRGGLKVFPAEVEEVIRLAPDVAEVAVVSAPDGRVGEVPVAFVVPNVGDGVDRAALEALCRTHLAPYKVPAGFQVVDELPRNEVGKVVGRALLERWQNGPR